jgi:predicted small metal-binding protein
VRPVVEVRIVMKSFACGDVVPGCTAKWLCSSEDELLAEVAAHARQDHGITEVPAELVDQIRSKILIVA